MKILLVVVAFIVRGLVGWAATGHGEMEGLAHRYEHDAYAVLAGYGLLRPVENVAPQIDLISLAQQLDEQGLRISPERVPPLNPELWRPSGIHPPGYAYYLALVYTLTGKDALLPTARGLQALLDALACLVLFAATQRLAGPSAATITAWAYALFLPAAYIATSRVADGLMPAASIFAYALWVRALSTRRLRDFAVTGVAIGLMSLLRPDFFLYPFFLGIIAILALRRARLEACKGSILLAACMFVVLLPWAARNYSAFGEFKFTSNVAGLALLQAVAQFPNPYDLPDADEDYMRIAQQAGYDGFDDPAVDRMFKQQYMDIVREDPLLLVRQVIQRLPQGLVPLYRWGYTNAYYYSGHSFYDMTQDGSSAYQVVTQRPMEVVRAYWDRLLFAILSFALLLASIAVAWLERKQPWTVAVLFAPWLYMIGSHALVSLGARLMVPVAFCQLIALGYLIVRRRTGGAITLAPWLEDPDPQRV